jgi:hypothetical protein
MSNGSGASRTQVARLTTVVGSTYTMLPGTTEWLNPQVPTTFRSSAGITGAYVPASSSTSVTFALQAAQAGSATSSFLNTGSTITVIGFN